MSDVHEPPTQDLVADEVPPSRDAPADTKPLSGQPAIPPARVEPVVVPRWIQLVAVPLAVLALYSLARAAGAVLLVFVVAAVIALILNPLVRLLQRAHLPRGVAVFAVYIGFFLAFGGVVALLVSPVSNQVQAFQKDVPRLTRSANQSLANLQTWLDDHGVGIKVKKQGETALQTLQKNVLRGSGTSSPSRRTS